MKRVVIPELLDTDSGTPQEIADSLLDLRGINQKFGGVSTMQSMIEHVAKRTHHSSFTLLEVAAGSGYVPETTKQRLRSRNLDLQITLLDRAKSHLPESSPSFNINSGKTRSRRGRSGTTFLGFEF